jgi:putative Holliday junction resolvase
LQTLLGFDYGSHRIGVAVGQDITGTASALCTLGCHDGKPDWGRIGSLIAEWSPDFSRELETRFQIPVYWMDEHLSSHAAKEVQRETPGRNRDGIDAVAARIILQNWLDTTRHA